MAFCLMESGMTMVSVCDTIMVLVLILEAGRKLMERLIILKTTIVWKTFLRFFLLDPCIRFGMSLPKMVS